MKAFLLATVIVHMVYKSNPFTGRIVSHASVSCNSEIRRKT